MCSPDPGSDSPARVGTAASCTPAPEGGCGWPRGGGGRCRPLVAHGGGWEMAADLGGRSLPAGRELPAGRCSVMEARIESATVSDPALSRGESDRGSGRGAPPGSGLRASGAPGRDCDTSPAPSPDCPPPPPPGPLFTALAAGRAGKPAWRPGPGGGDGPWASRPSPQPGHSGARFLLFLQQVPASELWALGEDR